MQESETQNELVGQNAAEHSVHLTGGYAPRFQAVFLAQTSSVKMALSRPSRPRVTHTVSWLLQRHSFSMKKPNPSLNVANKLVIGALALLFGGGGCAIAYFEFMVYDLPWRTYQVSGPPNPPERFVHIEYESTLADPTGDTIYVSTADRSVYSTTLFEDSWALAQANPKSEDDFFTTTTCAPQWPGAQADAEIWDPPPVDKNIVDSRGVRFEHAIAMGVRCYILFDDGHIEVWTREDSSLGAIAFMQCGSAYAIAGALIGILFGLGINHFRNRRASNAIKSPANTACT